MANLNQNFVTYAGDAAKQRFTAQDNTGAVVDLTDAQEIVWTAARDYKASPVYLRRLSDLDIDIVTPAAGLFQIDIENGDTTDLVGFYVHKAVVTTQTGSIVTVELGRWQVGPPPVATYSGDPQVSDRDNVRFLIGDTDMTNPILLDPEIDALLVKWQPPLQAAAQAARSIAARYSRRVTKRVGDFSINYGDLSKQFYALADELQVQANTFGLTPYSGGISRADKRAVNGNTDREKPPFHQKQFDNRSGTNNTSGFDQFDESDGS